MQRGSARTCGERCLHRNIRVQLYDAATYTLPCLNEPPSVSFISNLRYDNTKKVSAGICPPPLGPVDFL